MFVVAGVVHRETDLVELRRPREGVRSIVRPQVPLVDDLTQQTQGGGLNAIRMRLVDRISFGEHRDGPVAWVFVVDAAQHIVEEAFTKGARGNPHFGDVELLEDGAEDRDATGQDGASIGVEAGQLELI